MTYAIVGYREWSKYLTRVVKQDYFEDVKHYTSTPSYLGQNSAVFFVGWSEMIPEGYYKHQPCFVLHPSPLPLYRGGSPIQHQIMNGEKVSAVTIFKLDPAYPEVDSGPIVWQMGYSLEGSLEDILERIAEVGAMGVAACISKLRTGTLTAVPQVEGQWQVYKRRKPEESEIEAGAFYWYDAKDIHNKVRALQEPYPLPFVTCADGRRLYLLKTRVETDEEYEKRKTAHGEVERAANAEVVADSERAPSPPQCTAEPPDTYGVRCTRGEGHEGPHFSDFAKVERVWESEVDDPTPKDWDF